MTSRPSATCQRNQAAPAAADAAVGEALHALHKALAKPIRQREMASMFGGEYFSLPYEKQHELLVKVRAVRAVVAAERLLPASMHSGIAADVASVLYIKWGQRISGTQVRRWVATYRRLGFRGLVDRRGRPRQAVRISLAAMAYYAGLLARRATKLNAHRVTRRQALRRKWAWPASARTLAKILAVGVAEVEQPMVRGLPPGQHEYLFRGVSNN